MRTSSHLSPQLMRREVSLLPVASGSHTVVTTE